MDDKVIFKAKRLDNGDWVEGFFTKKQLNVLFVPVIERIRESDNGDYMESIEVDGTTVRLAKDETPEYVKTPDYIKDAISYCSQCESDLGFMGSPKYYEQKELIKKYFEKNNVH